ncbi:hypothetical protein [Streptomyces sp. ODS28]|uniref:hypothetical protein n=1 Tax=Streptomyces sp. ODS28 TaxID=3136688 RepID=UPI0031E5D17F
MTTRPEQCSVCDEHQHEAEKARSQGDYSAETDSRVRLRKHAEQAHPAPETEAS